MERGGKYPMVFGRDDTTQIAGNCANELFYSCDECVDPKLAVEGYIASCE